MSSEAQIALRGDYTGSTIGCAMDLTNLTELDLLLLKAAVDRELKGRGLPSDLGSIGEALAVRFFNETPGLPNLQLAPRGTKNVDAISRSGERYSIKSLKDARKTGTIYASADESHPLFEFMLIVLVSDRYELEQIYRLSWTQFVELRKWDKRMSAWYVPRSTGVFRVAEPLKSWPGGS
jgi:hypothetical protein